MLYYSVFLFLCEYIFDLKICFMFVTFLKAIATINFSVQLIFKFIYLDICIFHTTKLLYYKCMFHFIIFLYVANITCYSICSLLATNLFLLQIDSKDIFLRYSVFLPADIYLVATVLIVLLYLSLNKVAKRDKC